MSSSRLRKAAAAASTYHKNNSEKNKIQSHVESQQETHNNSILQDQTSQNLLCDSHELLRNSIELQVAPLEGSSSVTLIPANQRLAQSIKARTNFKKWTLLNLAAQLTSSYRMGPANIVR